MSRFFSNRYSDLEPYVPGEQPKKADYIKLNTNENPFPPSEKAVEAAAQAARNLNLYSDPESSVLTQTMADYYSVGKGNVLMTNGSDEILNFAFMAFCDDSTPAVFADITYGFYPVFARVNNLPFREIPLNPDFTIRTDDYINAGGTVFIANPNAPTSLILPVSEIRKIIEGNPDNIVVIDEAYIDFGGESCVPLIREYNNLLVTQTFSKSRSLAGARLGMGIACESLINDLNTVKYSTNPYNVNSMTGAAGIGVMSDAEYTEKNCKYIIECRDRTASELRGAGYEIPDSSTNFLFVRHPDIPGEKVYEYLRENGILVRHFSKDRISDYNRISIGTREQMDRLVSVLKNLKA